MNKTAIVERAGEMTKAPDYPALHGLRGIAAMTVVLQHFTTDARWHAKLFLHAGAIGVALFFVLSGFLMGRLYAPSACTVPAVLTFWRRRVARVMPLYLACVFAAYAFLHITGHNRPLFTVRWEDLWEHLMLWRASSVMWTIPIEMQFYALFPLIWLGLSRWRDATIVGLLLIVALLAALHPTRVPPLVPFAQFFILGVLAAQLNLRSSRSFDLVFAVAMCLLVFSWPGVRGLVGFGSPVIWSNPLYWMLLPALLLATLCSPLAIRVLGHPWPAFLGKISFSIYLLHAPIFHTFNMYTPLADWPRPLFLVVDLAVVIAAAAASCKYFETPMRDWISGKPSGKKQKPSQAEEDVRLATS